MISIHPKRLGRFLTLSFLSLMAVALGACREQEKNRPLMHEKGSYQGQIDQPLNDETLRALQQRGSHQGH